MPMSPRLFFRSYVEVTYHISHWQYFANVCRPCAQNVGTAWMTRDWQLYCALPLQNAAFWRFQKSRGLHLPVAKLLFLNSKGQSCYPMISGDFVVDLILHMDRDCTLIETCDEFFRSRCFIDRTFSEGTTTPPPSKTSSAQQDIRRIHVVGPLHG